MRGDYYLEHALADHGEGVGKGQKAVSVALPIPLGTDVFVLILPALVAHPEVHDDVLQALDLGPDAGLEDTVALLGGHHHVAIEAELGAPSGVKVAEKRKNNRFIVDWDFDFGRPIISPDWVGGGPDFSSLVLTLFEVGLVKG